jgi:hypothetical protein
MQLNFPVAGAGPVVTSPYGWRTHPILKTRKFHNGADLSTPQGTALVAPAAGRVVSVINNDVCGYGLIIEHDDTTRTGYCHLSRIDVKKGTRVHAGQQIGLSGGRKGSTGAGRSTGPHLHWIVYVKDGGEWKHTDPMLYVKEGGSSWPTITGLWQAAQSFWSDIWDSPSVDPTPPPTRKAPAAPTAPARPTTASWGVGSGVAMPVRLVEPSGAVYGPGSIPPGTYRVEAQAGGSWVATGGNLTAVAGRHYSISSPDGRRLQLVEHGT